MIIYSNRIKGGMKVKMLPLVLINRKHKGDKGLRAHELHHLKLHWAWFLVVGTILILTTHLVVAILVATSAHDIVYTFISKYRCWTEVQAYRRQLTYGGSINKAAIALVNNYDLKLTHAEAVALLS